MITAYFSLAQFNHKRTMAKFYKATKKPAKSPASIEINVEQFNHDGQGIGYINNKICFVEGALPGERVKAQLVQDKAKMAKARTSKILDPSPERINPPCAHFELCGGCQLQYANNDYQLQLKQQAVAGLFKRFAGIESLPWQDSLTATGWQYRRAARVGVWYETKTKAFTVGFRQQNSKFLTPINECAVLVEPFKDLFRAFAQILPTLNVGRDITHLEVVEADNANVVVIRHTRAMPKADKKKLLQLGEQNQWLMISSPEKGVLETLDDKALPELNYRLEPLAHDKHSDLTFNIGDFIQVNSSINQQMIKQAHQWLDLSSNDILLDLFCGIGNFSVPLACVCEKVVGVEGVSAMVERATDNALKNGLENCEFYQADLSQEQLNIPRNKPMFPWLQQPFTKVLLDPARAGAQQIMKPVAGLKAQKILYVSCEPLTLAQDSFVLLNSGYQLTKIALMDMFAQTRHVEVMALFEQKG